jgi:metal transporter CNNM
VRDVIAIDHNLKLEPILSFFKRGTSHLAIVTRVQNIASRDPTLTNLGIVTLEDILEELLQEEIEDEREAQDRRGERQRLRQRIVRAFSDCRAQAVLNRAELVAI